MILVYIEIIVNDIFSSDWFWIDGIESFVWYKSIYKRMYAQKRKYSMFVSLKDDLHLKT